MNYRALSDSQLESTLLKSVGEERAATVKVLNLLAEVERRRLHARHAPSLFEYCTKVLKYSSACAQRRIDAMRALRQLPELETKIESGELNITAVAQAQSLFRAEAKVGNTYSAADKMAVFQKLENKSTRECMIELAMLSPQAIPQERRRILTEDKTELRVVLDTSLVEKLDKLKAIFSHAHPNLTDQELIEKLADIALDRHDPELKAHRSRERQAARREDPNNESSQGRSRETSPHSRPLPAPEAAGSHQRSRFIPAATKHYVRLRDKNRCTYPGCGSSRFLEFDHIRPFAMGGDHSPGNLRLRCRTHNRLHAVEAYGRTHMALFRG